MEKNSQNQELSVIKASSTELSAPEKEDRTDLAAGRGGNPYEGYSESENRGRRGELAEASDTGSVEPGRRVTENVWLCPDGKYRWTYDFEMLKNPTILITVEKVLLLSFGIVFAFIILFDLIEGNIFYWDREDFVRFFGPMLILMLVFLVLGAISYLILAGIYGWTYQILFTMDEEGVEFRQMKKEFQKVQAMGWLAAAAGLASGNFGAAGAGILAATRDSSTSTFANVRKVKSVRRRHVIYVNQLLGHNQVYAKDEDFDFIRNYIEVRCHNAKIIN